MRSSPALHQLIHALSQAEKRYVKMFATQGSGQSGKNYLRLFDAINRQATYDEEALKIQFRSEKLSANFASEKSYLLRLILRAMRAFHTGKSPRKEVRNLLEDVEFLRGKGVYSQASKSLKKAEKLAWQNGLLDLLLPIQEEARRIILWQNHRDVENQLASLVEQRNRTLELLVADKDIWNIHDQLFSLVRKRYRLRTEAEIAHLNKLLDHPVLEQPPADLPFATQQRFKRIFAYAAQLRENYPLALEHYQAIVDQWECNPRMIALHPDPYKRALANYLSCCHLNNRLDLFPAILEALHLIPSQDHDAQGESQQNLLYYQLLYHINSGEFKSAMQMEGDINRLLEHYHHKVNHARRLAFHYNLAVAFFLGENFQGTLRMVQHIKAEVKSQHRQDIQQFVRVLEMVLHYEMGNYELMEHFFQSISRSLKSGPGFHPYERQVTTTLRKLPDLVSSSERKSALVKLRDELLTMNANPQNGRAPGMLELTYWLDSRIQDRPMRELVPVLAPPLPGAAKTLD